MKKEEIKREKVFDFNRYYYVPVTSKFVKFNGIPFAEMTDKIDHELTKRESTRLELTYGDYAINGIDENTEKYIERYNMETSLLYNALGIAENLVLVENSKGLHELATGLPVTTDNTIYLGIQEKTGEKVVDIFVEHPDYENIAKNFFESYKKSESYNNSAIKSK